MTQEPFGRHPPQELEVAPLAGADSATYAVATTPEGLLSFFRIAQPRDIVQAISFARIVNRPRSRAVAAPAIDPPEYSTSS